MRPAILLIALTLLLATTGASAQDCVLEMYGDEAGTLPAGAAAGDLEWEWGGPYPVAIYYIVRAEAFMLGASWSREFVSNSQGFELIVSEPIWQPYATFLETREEGYRIGLGMCHTGFGGNAIVLMKEILWIQHTSGAYPEGKSPVQEFGTLHLIPNVLQDDEHAMISDCAGVLSPCELGAPIPLAIIPVPVVGTSFGKIKAMYR